MEDKFFEQLEDMGAEIEDTLERMMGDKEMYLEFLEELPSNENVDLLQKAAADKDYETFKVEAHSLKGVFLNLGLLPLADSCIEMLMLAREGKNEEAIQVLPEFLETYAQFSQVIKDYFAAK